MAAPVKHDMKVGSLALGRAYSLIRGTSGNSQGKPFIRFGSLAKGQCFHLPQFGECALVERSLSLGVSVAS